MYVLQHGLTNLSLRPLARAIGSSPRVLLFLFDSKEALHRSMIRRTRSDVLAILERARDKTPQRDLISLIGATWASLADQPHRPLLTLWLESYVRSLTEPTGPCADFAEQTVDDWLDVLAAAQTSARGRDVLCTADCTLALAVLRGALLDLLATGDTQRATAAVRLYLELAS